MRRWGQCLAALLAVAAAGCAEPSGAPAPSPSLTPPPAAPAVDLPVRVAVPADPVGAVLGALLSDGLRAGDEGVIPQPVGDARDGLAALLDGRVDATVTDLDSLAGALAGRRAPAGLDDAADLVLGDLLPDGLAPLGLAGGAERGSAIAVPAASPATAVSDLAGEEPVVLGGPFGFEALEPEGVAGIEEAYGLDIAFQSLDLNALETYEAVRDGFVDALVLESSSPNLVREGLRPLEDDRGVFPAANVVVVVADGAVGQAARDAVSAAFDGLETAALAASGSRVLDGVPPGQVAAELTAAG